MEVEIPQGPVGSATTSGNTQLAPPMFQYPSPIPPVLITQGAEALLYRSSYLLPSIPCALKYRPSKPYRHPILDARLTRHRILSEARVLVRCRREGVPVPAVYALDENVGWLMVEWIDGVVVRQRINEWLKRRKDAGVAEGVDEDELISLLKKLGAVVGKLHSVGIVHGDLTTSNLMLRTPQDQDSPTTENGNENTMSGDVLLIDFGLASQSVSEEDRAVDLYVLERAFGSSHPRAERLFPEVLAAYGNSFKGANAVLKKLEEVRMRGRKRSMLG